jgi:hypothetical protein
MRIDMAVQVLERFETRRVKVSGGLLTVPLRHLDDVGKAFSDKGADLSSLIPRQYLLEFTDAQVTVPAHLALIRLLYASDQAEYRGFASPIAPDQADPFARLDG